MATILDRATLETRNDLESIDTIDAIIIGVEDPCNNNQVYTRWTLLGATFSCI